MGISPSGAEGGNRVPGESRAGAGQVPGRWEFLSGGCAWAPGNLGIATACQPLTPAELTLAQA